MGLFGKLIQTTIDIVTLPIDVVKAVVDGESAFVSEAKKIRDALRDACGPLDEDKDLEGRK